MLIMIDSRKNIHTKLRPFTKDTCRPLQSPVSGNGISFFCVVVETRRLHKLDI